MEVEEQGTGLLSSEDVLLVERLTGELISKALDLCDEKVNSFDEIIESSIDLPPDGDRSFEDLAEETRSSNKKKKFRFSSAENCILRSNSVDVSLTFSQTSNPGNDYVTPSWRRSLRRTQSEAALSQVDEGVEVEYLEHFDPFKGSLDLVSDVDEVLATSANKHPAEQTSFLQALQELSGKPWISCKMTDEKPNSVCFDCAESDEVDDTDVDGGFACKTTAGREDGLAESMKSQEPLFYTSTVAGIHNNDIPDLHSAGLRNDNESCSADTDVENRGPLNFENSIVRTNDKSENDTKLSMQSFNEDHILNSSSLNMADSDCRNNIFIMTSVIEEGAPPSHPNDRETDDTNDRGTDDTLDRVTDDTNDRGTNDTSDKVTDDTSDRVTDYMNDKVTDDTSDRVTDDTNDRVTDDTSDKVKDASARLTDDSCIVGSISASSLLNVQTAGDCSTCSCMTSKNLKSDQDNSSDQCILPKPACAHVALNSVISVTEDVTKADGRSDLKAADTNPVQPVNLDDTVSDVDGLANISFLSTDTEADFSSFSAAEKFVREILSRSRGSSSSTSSPRKSCGAAINADSRMYNTLTFLDNDDSDDGEGGTDRDRISDHDRKNKTTTEATDGNEKLDNHKHPASDVNDNPSETGEENASAVHTNDSEPTAAKKKIVPNLELLTCDDLDLNFSPRGSVPDLHLGDYYNDHTPDDLDSPDDLANPVFDSIDDWTDDLNDPPVEPIPEYTAREEYEDVRNWRPVQIAGISYRIDMRAIEPYKKVLSHGGYYGNGLNAIVVFAACYLPDRSRLDYRYIMDNLFLYVVSVLELLVVEDYMIIYFHAATSRNKVPALRWLKRCYDMIDHRLRKNLQRLLVVHPTFFLKTVVLMTKPFISSKFSSKLHYVRSLGELTHLVPTEYIHLPEEVKEVDRSLNPNTPAPQKKFINL